MQTDERTGTVIFVSGRMPEPAIEQLIEAYGAKLHWARSIDGAANLLNLAPERTVIITELALVDGNWRDLVERFRSLEKPVPIILVSLISTAELWWDALECSIEDILMAPLSVPQLSQILSKQFTDLKSIRNTNENTVDPNLR